MKHLVIIGTGSFAREVYSVAKGAIGYNIEWDIKGFIDGDVKSSIEDYEKLLVPVWGDVYNYNIEKDDVFCCAIGEPEIRRRIISIIESRGGEFISLIHESAYICDTAQLGNGVIVGVFTTIGDNAVIGNHVVFNSMVGIAHDAIIGDYTCMMTHVNITGYCIIGECTYWGSGSRILPKGKVGNNSFIGAGSVVLKKVKANKKVFGVPAVEIPF